MRESRSGSVLVLNRRSGDEILFEFRGKRWSLITLVLSIFVGFGLYGVADQSKYPELLRITGIIFGSLLIFSSIHNYFSVRTLIIDAAKLTIKYRRSDFFHNENWERPFSYFKELRIFRNPISTSAGKSAFLRLSLVDKNGSNIILGTSELGIYGMSRAKRIGEEVSSITTLPLVVEKGLQI